MDIDGFLLSTEFLSSIASIITAILSALFSSLLGGVFPSST